MEILIVDIKDNIPHNFYVLTSNLIYKEKISYIDKHTAAFMYEMEGKYGLKFNNLVAIGKKDKNLIVELCKNNNIEYTFYDYLIQDYIEYCDNLINEHDIMKDSIFNESVEFETIIEVEVEPIHCSKGTTRFLYEELISKKDKIKIWIGSNERVGHNKPHIHASYDNKLYAVFNLVDLEVIKSNAKKGLNAKTKEMRELIEKNIIKARSSWNRSTGLMKFPTINDEIPYKTSLIKK